MPQQQHQHTFRMTRGGFDNNNGDDDDGEGGFRAPSQSQSRRQQARPKASSHNYPLSGLSQPTHPIRRTIQFGNKDLIIRMLAEIFQVKQDENGLVRWQQISTSLVPISLYSRTTSKWLDYLLAASASIQTNDPANAMSPDSRDFLLLLQQFHQQTRPTIHLNRSETLNNFEQHQQQQLSESIVFQVIGHDVINGQCKKILNVKIKQPGTRLGQASDYFVYWREQSSVTNQKFHNLHHQQFSASSFASNNSFMQQTPKKTAHMLNYPATNLSRTNNRATASNVQTWGLNFASINDAKLFYDICSLNLVDLDFNSEYLKQLPIRETTQYQQREVINRKIPMATNSPNPQLATCTKPKQQTNQLQLQQLQQQYQLQQRQKSLKNRYQKTQQNLTKMEQAQHKALARGQSSMSRCPSCKQAVNLDQRRSETSVNQQGLKTPGDYCPVHGNDLRDTIRKRSQSTTRQISSVAKENENFKRARSFSTPVSPEPDQCPVHRHRHIVRPDYDQQAFAQLRSDQQLEQIKYSIMAQDFGPKKPARGQLRLSQTANSQESSSNACNLQYNLKKHNKQMQQKVSGNLSPFQTTNRIETDTFDTIARRDARLARARYANSKNMKEFLSLDAGGLQSTPTQQGFHRQQYQQTRQQQAQKILTDNNSLHQRKPAMSNRKFQQSTKQTVQPSASEHLVEMASQEARDGTQCNASTTTDDLPMDMSTRRRMLKLTSEEIISERTEPKSISTSTAIPRLEELVVDSQATNREEKIDRQLRAVSLGPDSSVDTKIGGRAARSDASRRRSLERSTCIDLDASLPASSFMKNSRLSPLHQSSVSPQGLATSGGGSLKSSPSWSHPERGAPAVNIPSASKTASTMKEHNGLNDQLDDMACETQSYGHDEQHQIYQISDLVAGQFGTKSTFHEQQMLLDRKLAAFKSAPDIRLTELEQADGTAEPVNTYEPYQPAEVIYINDKHQRGGHDARSHLSDNILKHGRQSFHNPRSASGLPQGRSNLSSYAVPLCSTVKRSSQRVNSSSRQCQSCPSSLRRKRMPPNNSDIPEVGIVHECAIPPMYPNRYPQMCSCRQVSCTIDDHLGQNANLLHQHCDCYLNPGNNMIPYPDGARQNCESIYSNLPPTHAQHYFSQQRPCCNHNLTYHHHHYCNKSNKDSLSYVKRVALNPEQSQPTQSFRSHSSQSNRSPLQYGLYESDFEDELARINQEFIEPSGACHDSFNRSQSAYFQPTIIKPVQGYDQTMARVTLKSRQRSRSQPPGCSTDAESSFHLTKSMENVEKLIKEVQNELRALKRQPLGIANIDMKTTGNNQTGSAEMPKNRINTASRIQEDSAAKMSIDENEINLHDQSDSKFSCTSATRRAGQFKCVGAIRKAGFLSVKKWILKRRQSIELARKQGWKRYWVCLRGTALLFHSVIENRIGTSPTDEELDNQTDLLSWIQKNCSSQMNFITNLLQTENEQKGVPLETFFKNMSQVYIEKEPRHLIIIDGSIAQPIPEHPRRDFVFCLSTTFGDAYLFQASCQLESDNWTSAIHNACAASIARDLTREEAIKLFESKIRHFELEAEKKIFLRQRLESRLTSMSSICNVSRLNPNINDSDRYANCDELNQDKNKLTMRSLLYQLNQQLLALDTYIEQLRCEVYQLRCYLSSCGAQNVFYQNMQQQQEASINQSNIPNDLPHPKSLLMHVSKPTKLLLIKLGVFTVSSFHAYIHARQDSAKTILQQIQNTTASGNSKATCSASSLELKIRSHSISESLLSKTENVKLEDDTENLLEMANLKKVTIQLSKSLICHIKRQDECDCANSLIDIGGDTSDDRFSVQDLGENINLNLRLNPSSTSSSIIKQVLKIIEPDSPELEFLNYYLRLVVSATKNSTATADHLNKRQLTNFYTVKRKETLKDWSNYMYIELMKKIIFRVELNRSRMEEEVATPFGISIDGQLFSSKYESVLNVYCNYIEWGSVADKAGLQDEDEFLLINGIPLGDLDLMFVECIIQDSCKLKAVVRSAANEYPPKVLRLDQTTWRPLDDNGENNQGGRRSDWHQDQTAAAGTKPERDLSGVCSQIISDAYLTSLVCPPPPAKSSAFLRTDLNMLRQKSDLGMERVDNSDASGTLIRTEVTNSSANLIPLPKSKSQHRIDSTMNIDAGSALGDDKYERKDDSATLVKSSVDLAKQLLNRTERLTKLLGKDPINEDKILSNVHLSTSSCGSKAEHNHLERLQKSILELIETEYAYIRHLETISEHYMSPLEETGFLNIIDLKSFNRVVLALLRLQREFFDMLTTNIARECQLNINESGDEFERFNEIIQKTDSFKKIDNLEPILTSIAKLFLSEGDKFRFYTSYCVAYSKLQKLLHPKNLNGTANPPGISIASVPNALNTFSTSLTSNSIGGLGHFTTQQRISRLVNLTVPNGNSDQNTQLKHLTEFLGNLDSSSSSASISLAKSSESDSTTTKKAIQNSANSTHHKSVHQQNFESYLIKPIQRIVKYPMLLNSIGLAAQAYYSSEPIQSDLKCAIKHMETIANHVNDMQRVHDEYGLTFENIEKQYFEQQALAGGKTVFATSFGPHQPEISLDVAQLLYFGAVEWLNISELSSKAKKIPNLNSMLFVFQSCVVFICKERIRVTKRRLPLKSNDVLPTHQTNGGSSNLSSKVFPWSTNNGGEQFTEIVRYQTLIPVSEVQVRSVPVDHQTKLAEIRAGNSVAKSPTSVKYLWELFQCSSSNSNSSLLTKTTSTKRTNKSNDTGKVYLLSSPSNEERSTFLRKIRYIIRESVRNMSLPMHRSPSLMSKKLSTSSAASATSNANINSSCSPANSLTVR